MGWLILGLAIGWLTCSLYGHALHKADSEAVGNGAMVVISLLFILAMIVGASSLNWGAHVEPTPTPTSLGR